MKSALKFFLASLLMLNLNSDAKGSGLQGHNYREIAEKMENIAFNSSFRLNPCLFGLDMEGEISSAFGDGKSPEIFFEQKKEGLNPSESIILKTRKFYDPMYAIKPYSSKTCYKFDTINSLNPKAQAILHKLASHLSEIGISKSNIAAPLADESALSEKEKMQLRSAIEIQKFVLEGIKYEHDYKKYPDGIFAYFPNSIKTLSTGRGVCWDKANLMADLLNSIGINARTLHLWKIEKIGSRLDEWGDGEGHSIVQFFAGEAKYIADPTNNHGILPLTYKNIMNQFKVLDDIENAKATNFEMHYSVPEEIVTESARKYLEGNESAQNLEGLKKFTRQVEESPALRRQVVVIDQNF